MRKRITSISLFALLAFAGISAWAQENDRLSFGVISDIHLENNVGEGAMFKVPRALKNLTSHKALDAIAIVGDVANAGKASEYEMVRDVSHNQSTLSHTDIS